MFRMCIVGSGPAAFYTAMKLLKTSQIKVDMFEKLPVPFGLIRYGVAPDHPEVKNVINTFNQVAMHNNFRFFGNVNIGKDVSVKELKNLYDNIILAYGAAVDKRLGIPGEDLKQVYSAIDMVGWYNGLPEKEKFLPDLSGEEAVIIGHGNVALDIARILLSSVDLLKNTDIPEHVLDQLSYSRLKRVHLVGRRGPLQAAFTIKEFREIVKISQVSSRILISEDIDLNAQIIETLPRPRKRLTNLILEVMKSGNHTNSQDRNINKTWFMHFLRSPEIILSKDLINVSGLRLGVNMLQGENVVHTKESIDMPCQMVIRSIGYRSLQIDPDIPFDHKLNVIPNIKGRIIEDLTEDSFNMYCVGWIKRGPVGVIINTLADAHETSDTILADIQGLQPFNETSQDVEDLLKSKAIKFISFSDWQAIDKFETSVGERKGKPREKLVTFESLINAALKNRKKK